MAHPAKKNGQSVKIPSPRLVERSVSLEISPENSYRTALRNSFSIFNLTVMALLVVYAAVVYSARPHFYARLSDHIDRVTEIPELTGLPDDLTAMGAVFLDEFGSSNPPRNGLVLSLRQEKTSMLFLRRGGEIIPEDRFFGGYLVMAMIDRGTLTPLFLVPQEDKIIFSTEGMGGRFYSVGETDRVRILDSKIESYDMNDSAALALEGRNVNLLDFYTFKIPSIRHWKRKPAVVPIQGTRAANASSNNTKP